MTTPAKIAQMLNSNDGEKNRLEVIESKFSTEIIDNLITKLSNNDYLVIINEVKSIKMIIKSLNFLINKDYEDENKVILIENIISSTTKLEKYYLKRIKKIDSQESFTIENTIEFYIKQFLIFLFFCLIILSFSLL